MKHSYDCRHRRRRPLLKQIKHRKRLPRWAIRSETSAGAPSDSCIKPAVHAHARSHSLRVCCSISASAALTHCLIIRACTCHNATSMGVSLALSHHPWRASVVPAARVPQCRARPSAPQHASGGIAAHVRRPTSASCPLRKRCVNVA